MTLRIWCKQLLIGLILLLVMDLLLALAGTPLSGATSAQAAPNCLSSGPWLARWRSQSPNPTLAQGGQTTLTASFDNLGSSTLPTSGVDVVGLFRDDEPAHANDFAKFTYPGLSGFYNSRVAKLTSPASPGATGNFFFTIQAPANLAPGTYRIDLGLARGGETGGGIWIESNSSGNGVDCGARVWFQITVTPSLSNISGYVRDSGGAGLSGVSVSFGSACPPVITDSSGFYNQSGFANGTYTVIPNQSGYSFTPASRSVTVSGVSQSGLNFTGNASSISYNISGYVRDSGGAGLSGVSVSFGSAHPPVTTDSSGFYNQSGFANGTYTVTPSQSRCTFTPSSQSVPISSANRVSINFAGGCVSTPTWQAGDPTPAQPQIDVPQTGTSSITTISVLNTSSVAWSNIGPDAVSLNYRWESGDTGSNSNQDSAFYCADWINHHRVGFMNEGSVAPGATATFKLWMCNPTNLAASAGYSSSEHFAIAHGDFWIPTATASVSKLLTSIKVSSTTPQPAGCARVVSIRANGQAISESNPVHLPQQGIILVTVELENGCSTVWRSGIVQLIFLDSSSDAATNKLFACPLWEPPTAPWNFFLVGRVAEKILDNDSVAPGERGIAKLTLCGNNQALRSYNAITKQPALKVFLINPIVPAGEDMFKNLGDVAIPISVANIPQPSCSFRPSDGYAFQNRGRTSTSWNLFRATFAGSADSEFYLADGSHRPEVEDFFKSNFAQVGVGGSCYGFAASAMVRFSGHPETIEPNILSPEHRTLAANLMPDTNDIRDYIFLYQARQSNREHKNFNGARGLPPQKTYYYIKAALVDCKSDPITLSMSQITGGNGHAVVPYRVEESGNMGKIYIYDNNCPGVPNTPGGLCDQGSDRFINVNLTTGVWDYQGVYGDPSGKGGLGIQSVLADFPSRLPLDLSSRTRISALGSAGNLLISDRQGRRLGYHNGHLVSEIPEAEFIPTFMGTPDDPEPLETYSLPTGDYRIEAQGVATGTYTVTAYTKNAALTLTGLGGSAGQTSIISVTSVLSETRIQPAAALQDYCVRYAATLDTTKGRSFDLCTSTAAGAEAKFTAVPDGSSFSYRNTGAATPYTFRVTQVGSGAFTQPQSDTLGRGDVFTWDTVLRRVYLPLIQYRP